MVVIQPGDEIVSYGLFHHEPEMFHPKKFRVNIQVHPLRQKQGIGTLLYEKILEEVNSLNAVILRANAREDRKEVATFLEKRGFEEKRREWESRLNLQDFKLEEFYSSLETVLKQGIDFTTMIEEKEKTTDWDYRLFELDNTLWRDVPKPDPYTPITFEEYKRSHFKSPTLMPDAYFIAKDKEFYIGRCCLHISKASPQDLYQGLTGIRPEYHRRGIAMALKYKAIEYAKNYGYKTIKTWNDSINTGMLAINEELGFVRQPAWKYYEKKLTPIPLNSLNFSDIMKNNLSL